MELDEIIEALQRMAVVLELKGANPFKTRAFANSARSLKRLEGALELIDAGRIDSVKGIGKGLAADIAAMRASSRFAALDELAADVPAGVFDILALPGLGPKKVRTIWEDLGATNLGELEYACLENRLKDLKGFGPATQEKVLAAIDFSHRQRGLHLMNVVRPLSDKLLDALVSLDGVQGAAVVGGVRRAKLVTRDVDLLLAHALPASLGDALAATSLFDELQAEPTDALPHRWVGRTDGGVPVELIGCTPADWGLSLVRATGAPEHLRQLEARGLGQAAPEGAGASGAVSRVSADDTDAPAAEAAVYRALGLDWVPPELREGQGEVDAAAKGPLPTLVTRADLRGAWHNHTDWSDGAHTLEDMSRAAAERGLTYLGISDHSRAAFYAHGLDGERLAAQADALAALTDLPCRLLHGLEADILPDGGVDLSGPDLERLDFCVASVHSVFGMTEADMTERVVSALADPSVTILGHPTGRLLLSRDEFPLDMEAVLDACVEHQVTPELNANPHRLDLDTEALRAAKARGLRIAINADAHHTEGLDDLRYGIAAARRAGLTPADVLNCDALE